VVAPVSVSLLVIVSDVINTGAYIAVVVVATGTVSGCAVVGPALKVVTTAVEAVVVVAGVVVSGVLVIPTVVLGDVVVSTLAIGLVVIVPVGTVSGTVIE